MVEKFVPNSVLTHSAVRLLLLFTVLIPFLYLSLHSPLPSFANYVSMGFPGVKTDISKLEIA